MRFPWHDTFNLWPLGAIIVIVAIVSRQIYLRSAAETDVADADEEPPTMMLIRCETMHDRLQHEHVCGGRHAAVGALLGVLNSANLDAVDRSLHPR